jgi:uncharacterized protein (DUF983 family)
MSAWKSYKCPVCENSVGYEVRGSGFLKLKPNYYCCSCKSQVEFSKRGNMLALAVIIIMPIVGWSSRLNGWLGEYMPAVLLLIGVAFIIITLKIKCLVKVDKN